MDSLINKPTKEETGGRKMVCSSYLTTTISSALVWGARKASWFRLLLGFRFSCDKNVHEYCTYIFHTAKNIYLFKKIH
jgi:hypothetical protein